ncbi:MAG TPA: hypothetical protein DCY80_13435 [Solibacterales bacterium]|nr:hypothetical protein [Bryobacterales bacterium]
MGACDSELLPLVWHRKVIVVILELKYDTDLDGWALAEVLNHEQGSGGGKVMHVFSCEECRSAMHNPRVWPDEFEVEEQFFHYYVGGQLSTACLASFIDCRLGSYNAGGRSLRTLGGKHGGRRGCQRGNECAGGGYTFKTDPLPHRGAKCRDRVE